MRRIAIIGSAGSTRQDAPWNKPDWEKWGLSPDPLFNELDCIFEVHDLSEVKPEISGAIKQMRHGAQRLIYRDPSVGLLSPESSYQYPLKDIVKLFNREYLTSSIAYMLALAIKQEPDEIGIWGVDMATEDEYGIQRPCAHYYLGFAQGKGIKLTIPENSALLKAGATYGKKPAEKQEHPISEDFLDKRLAEYRKQSVLISGAMQELSLIKEFMKLHDRGGKVPGG